MDDAQFDRWFAEWKGTRPDTSPIGWYDIHELAAAFTAGVVAEKMRPLDEILARSHALEAELGGRYPNGRPWICDMGHPLYSDGAHTSVEMAAQHLHPADERPGSSPPAGPLP